MASIISWMSANATHPDAKAVVATYALGIDKVSCLDCADGFPAVICDFAASQDKIGWGDFGILQTILHSGVAPLALCTLSVPGQMGYGLHHTTTPGDAGTMDLSVSPRA